eukprot:TRINITY_DN17287_c0_g1_i1.p1 TRINITY_DN17287_c0_g1~~TRINITY_DN17287_c0_g1_i1.p1  ORF type:complete len:457 (+),score=48.66 TRINITY_DN17287_c0_g1_i1:37-1407(+)
MACSGKPSDRLASLMGNLPEALQLLMGADLSNLAALTELTNAVNVPSSDSTDRRLQDRVCEVLSRPASIDQGSAPVYKCIQPDCTRQYRTKNGWARHLRTFHSKSASSSEAVDSNSSGSGNLVEKQSLWSDYSTSITPPTSDTSHSNSTFEPLQKRISSSLQYVGHQQPMLDEVVLASCRLCHQQMAVTSLDSHYLRCLRRRSKRSRPTHRALEATSSAASWLQTRCLPSSTLLAQPLAQFTRMPRPAAALDLDDIEVDPSSDDDCDSNGDAASVDSGVDVEPVAKRSKAQVKPTRATRTRAARGERRPAASPKKTFKQVTTVTARSTVKPVGSNTSSGLPSTAMSSMQPYGSMYRSQTGMTSTYVTSQYPSRAYYSRSFPKPYSLQAMSSQPYSYMSSYSSPYAQYGYSPRYYQRPMYSATPTSRIVPAKAGEPPALIRYEQLEWHLRTTYDLAL